MNLTIHTPRISQFLHSNRRNDSQGSGFKFRSSLVDGDVWCDTHLGDEGEVGLVTRWLLENSAWDIWEGKIGVPFIVNLNLHHEEFLLIPKGFSEGFRTGTSRA